MNIPQDPYILLSYINTKLRDQYSSLDAFCLDLDIDDSNIRKVLSSINYAYITDKNQFTPI
jgi:hypothetical protein